MASQKRVCSYQYDALDRLASRSSAEQGATRRFYCADRLSTESQGSGHRTYIRGPEQLLAQQDGVAKMIATALIAPDRSNSVLAMIGPGQHVSIVYNPYGHRTDKGLLPGLPGFNGEHPDPLTGHYLLGNGYRAYNPVLMRFNSPDSLSPFGEGGLNAYMYCHGDPVNRRDPSGHADFLDALKDAVPYIALAASAMGSVVLYKYTKVRFRKWRAGNATKADKFVAAGTVGVIASSVTTAAGSIIRIAYPESRIAYPLLALGAIGVIGFQGMRYAGHKLGKPTLVPAQPSQPTETVTQGSSGNAADIRGGRSERLI